MAEDSEMNYLLDLFPELVWEEIFLKIKNPKDIQNVCKSSAYFDLLMTYIGRKGEAQFGMVYPLIRPYLGQELELLTRDFSNTFQTRRGPAAVPVQFIERAKNYQEALDEGEFGKLRQVCPYWRKIVWKDALRRLKMKYKEFSYPPDFPSIPGLFRYLILTRGNGHIEKKVWYYSRRMLYHARDYTARYFQHRRYVSTVYLHDYKDISLNLEDYKNPESVSEIKDLILSAMVSHEDYIKKVLSW